MTDAISRSTLQKEFDEKCIHDCEFCPWYLHWVTEDLEREGTCVLIQKAAAIDAVPVVRCVDCKFRCTMVCPMYHSETCLDDLDGFDNYDVDRTDDDGFCYLGERWDGDPDG